MSQTTEAAQERTTLTLTADELTELAYHIGAGDVLLKKKSRLLYRVVEAMTRLGRKPPSARYK
ncbi:hypothetical protein [Streptomyces sp. NPDC008092]|uniref:hypothetical protein n=1 Tax=Streptomyces sp. NPDC008092 TaxID=3364808 RepID=UPI0036E16756